MGLAGNKQGTEETCKTILVVEDDQAICEMVSELLRLEGYPVVTASNGRESFGS